MRHVLPLPVRYDPGLPSLLLQLPPGLIPKSKSIPE